MAIYAECITFAAKFGKTAHAALPIENNTGKNNKKKSYEGFKGKKTLDNPDDGDDADSRGGIGGGRTVVRV